jgi:hypothetical protein
MARDATLIAPRLLLPRFSQYSSRAIPAAQANGVRCLMIPVKFKKPEAAA